MSKTWLTTGVFSGFGYKMTKQLLEGGNIIQKAARLSDLLKKYSGSRQKAAGELGVSRTTLWRYMKKYGIGKDFTY